MGNKFRLFSQCFCMCCKWVTPWGWDCLVYMRAYMFGIISCGISSQFGVNSYLWRCGSYCACECSINMEVM